MKCGVVKEVAWVRGRVGAEGRGNCRLSGCVRTVIRQACTHVLEQGLCLLRNSEAAFVLDVTRESFSSPGSIYCIHGQCVYVYVSVSRS